MSRAHTRNVRRIATCRGAGLALPLTALLGLLAAAELPVAAAASGAAGSPAVRPVALTSTVNLQPNPSFESATSPVDVAGGTAAVSTADHMAGTRSLAVTMGGDSTFWDWDANGPIQAPVHPGNTYTASIYVKTNKAGVTARLWVDYDNASHEQVGAASTPPLVALAAGAWTRLTTSFTPTLGVAFVSLSPDVSGGAPGTVVYNDQAQVESGSVATPYNYVAPAPTPSVTGPHGGVIYSCGPHGSHEVYGAIGTKYTAMGAAGSVIGCPTTDEHTVTGGRQSDFAAGVIDWSPATGAHEVHGAINTKYRWLGGPGSSLGLPISDEHAAPEGGANRQSDFQHGSIHWTAATGVTAYVPPSVPGPTPTPTPAGASVTFRPTVTPMSAPEIANTGRGQYEWSGIAADPPGWPQRDVYYRDEIHWNANLEPSPGVYNDAIMEQGMAHAKAMGGRFGFRVMSMNDSADYTPAEVAKQPGTNLPDWNSPSFLTAWSNLMRHLGAKYDNDPRLAFVDMGGYGNYGEWHTYGIGGASITAANAQTVINAVVSAFPHKHILMMTANPAFLQQAMNTSPRIGVRIDCLGATNFYGSTVDSVPDAVNRWRTAPFVAEWCGASNGAPSEYALADEQVAKYHFSMLSDGNYPTRYGNMSGADKASFEHANKESGYRNNLVSVTVPGQVRMGTPFSLASTWNNAGVAPAYDQWSVHYQLRTGSGAVVWTGTSSLAMTSLLPGQKSVTDSFTLPSSIAAGSYQLTVKVDDPSGSTVSMALAQGGAHDGGSYSLGGVAVG